MLRYTPSAADYLSAVFLLNTYLIFHAVGALILLFFIQRGTCRLV